MLTSLMKRAITKLLNPPQPVPTQAYVVYAFRWGEINNYDNVLVNVFLDRNKAIAEANDYRDRRGGKYATAVYSSVPFGSPICLDDLIYYRQSISPHDTGITPYTSAFNEMINDLGAEAYCKFKHIRAFKNIIDDYAHSETVYKEYK